MTKEINCDYCEENVATKKMEHRIICRDIESGRKILDDLTEPVKYWCDECWNKMEIKNSVRL